MIRRTIIYYLLLLFHVSCFLVSSSSSSSLSTANDEVTTSTTSQQLKKNHQQQSLLFSKSDRYDYDFLYEQEDDRILATSSAGASNDDDGGRHTKEPNEENSSNGPAEVITRIPSASPSLSSSTSPTFIPSPHPSIIPSRYPSNIPSQTPTIPPTQRPTISNSPTIRQPCSKYNEYNFGHFNFENDENKIIVNYNYDVESDVDIANVMGDSLIDQTKVIEATLLNLLIELYFPECSNISSDVNVVTSTRRKGRGLRNNIFEPDDSTRTRNYQPSSSNDVTHNSTKLIGLSSRPIDWTNGGEFI